MTRVLPNLADETGGRQNEAVIADLGFAVEMRRLRSEFELWIIRCDDEMREALEWQLLGPSKYFRPLTVFCCSRAVNGPCLSMEAIRSAFVVELFHNVSLIIDDIVDHSRHRRGKLTLHCRFGTLRALMTAGYIVAEGYHLSENDPQAVRLLSELLQRLGVAECLQWRLRQQPLGVEDWRRIAGEDTGSMFEVCAALGARDERLRRFGHLLGVLYHGCDDVGDVKGLAALGGGGQEDLRDGILTLPAALAIRDPAVAAMFRDPAESDLRRLAEAFESKLPEAEHYLDRIAAEACEEARHCAPDPTPLFALVDQTRELSSR
jgi:geranylgeranyl diphosphate synthase, type I